MKRLFAAVLVLCMLFGADAAFAQEEKQIPRCGNPEHYVGDGLDHTRPEICWITGHFNCDGMTHERAACKIHRHYACDGEVHEMADCGVEGHWGCDWREHETPVCGVAGHCTTDGMNHRAASCGVAGHFNCDGTGHRTAPCKTAGHATCDGMTHTRSVCGKYGHYDCDGLVHEVPVCGRSGHCSSDGLTHETAVCGYAGHVDCDGKNHAPASCGVEGHFACAGGRHYTTPISKYCNAYPQHLPCEGNPQHYCDPVYGGCGDMYTCSHSNAHTACRMCGLLWCDRSLGGHETPCDQANHRPCVYTMSGRTYVKADHDFCGYCGYPRCDGEEHGNTKCVPACQHCGYPEKMNMEHLQPCGKHYWCLTTGNHGVCTCGVNYACNESHTCPAK